MTDAEKRKAAIDTVAKHAIALGWQRVYMYSPLQLGLAEDDRRRVRRRAQVIVDSIAPSLDQINAALEHLREDTDG